MTDALVFVACASDSAYTLELCKAPESSILIHSHAYMARNACDGDAAMYMTDTDPTAEKVQQVQLWHRR
jgi:hypothetical protein